MTYLRKVDVKYQDSANLDAFARLRMSAPETVFDSKQLSDKQTLFWDDQLVPTINGKYSNSKYNK